MSAPLISIITVCYNAQLHIEQTIQSVICQSYKNIEYIIVDGGSHDCTVEIIKRYVDKIDQWVSEPDAGIADAMNKGLKMVNGAIVLFLHADDYLLTETSVADAVKLFDERHEIFAFCIRFHSDQGTRLLCPKGFGWRMNFKTGFLHQAVFCKKALFDRIGVFDKSFTIAMDYDFFLRAYRCGTRAKLRRLELSAMRDTGISSRLDWQDLKIRFSEEKRVQYLNADGPFLRVIYFWYWTFYLPYRRAKCLLRKPFS